MRNFMSGRGHFPPIVIILMLSLFFSPACAGVGGEAKNGLRPPEWATPLTVTGVPNLHKVSDALYRSAQFDASGVPELTRLGIKTVISLRGSKKDRELLAGGSFRVIHLPVNTFFPKQEPFRKFLEIVGNPENQPVLIHCKHGADRTGAAVALYRIHLQGWSVEKALDEMVNGGYNFHKIHSSLKGFVRKFPSIK